MTDPLSRVPIVSNISDAVYEGLLDPTYEDIVTTDVKSQNPSGYVDPITPEQRELLYEDPWAWKSALIVMKESVEMTLTSVHSRIATLKLHIYIADFDTSYTATFWEQGEQVIKDFDEMITDLASERNRRVNSVRFLHAVEAKILETKAAIRALS